MRYAIVIEKGERNYSAYVPDLPGCVATGATLDDVKSEIRNAIELHLEGMREDGEAIPLPTSRVDVVEVAIKAA
jgi:predicted RNase H-like HicB family nuclease